MNFTIGCPEKIESYSTVNVIFSNIKIKKPTHAGAAEIPIANASSETKVESAAFVQLEIQVCDKVNSV